MAILRKQIAQRYRGALQEREDWWHLCYDTELKEFFVEHDWHHMDAYRSDAPVNQGCKREAVEGYRGPGAEKVDEAKSALIDQAGDL